MYEQTSMIAPPQAEAKPAARYYEINEDTARNAHYCVHMSDYQPGSATNGLPRRRGRGRRAGGGA